ncbi:5157_t:CDS:1, partial [Dentiscutata heterogama]
VETGTEVVEQRIDKVEQVEKKIDISESSIFINIVDNLLLGSFF